jgi:hypothetical protein
MTRFTAVVDRFEGDDAVLLIEHDGEDVEDIVVPREFLPEDARVQDAVLSVGFLDGELIDVTFDPDETARRKESAQSRFDRLARRPPSDEE